MSCFGCCEEDDIHKAADYGGQYTVKSSAGNISWLEAL
jgi:pto-interacting protein 1